MKQFKIGKDNYIGVEVPEGASEFKASFDRYGYNYIYYLDRYGIERVVSLYNPLDNYEIIGLVGELRTPSVAQKSFCPEYAFVNVQETIDFLKEVSFFMKDLIAEHKLTNNTLILKQI